MNATVTELPPLRTLTLPCGHEQETRARAGSAIDCRTCGRHVKVSQRAVDRADGRPRAMRAPRPARSVRVTPARRDQPAGWDPVPIERQAPETSPGTCPGCGRKRQWTSRATLAWCPHCQTAGLAPATLTAHSPRAGPQRARDPGERDDDDREMYRQAQQLLDDIADDLRDPDLTSDDRADLSWLRDELVRARRERNAERVRGLVATADSILAGLPTWYDDLDDDQAVTADDTEPDGDGALTGHVISPTEWSAYVIPAGIPTRPAPAAAASTEPGEPSLVAGRMLVPRRLRGSRHPLLEAGDAARQQMDHDGRQLARALDGRPLTGAQLAEATGNGWQPSAIAARSPVVHQLLCDLARAQTGPQPNRGLLVRIIGGLAAAHHGLPSGPAADPTAAFWQRYDRRQAATWRAR